VGARVRTLLGDATVAHHELGVVRVPSGTLVAADPTSLPEGACAWPVPAGVHPVELRVAELDGGDQRSICAVVRFGGGEPDEWRPATPAEYPIDSGTGSFCDARAVPAVSALVDAWVDEGDDREFLIFDVMAEHYVHTWSWANVPVGDELNIVAFSTGIGDGAGVTVFGFRRGRALPVLALTDFLLLDDDEPVARRTGS
jgi:hypothetical protein